jgi:hypothetical protein
MSEKLQESERKELLERLGIYLPKDEEFREMLEREGMGYLIRKDVQESFTPAEIETISKDVDDILAELAASSSGLSGNERIISEVLKKEGEKLGTFTFKGIDLDVREKGYAWKGKINICMSGSDWSKATKQVELITQITLIKLARTRGLVPKVTISFQKEEVSRKKAVLTLEEAVVEIENFARKSLGDNFIMVKKRLQKRFSTKEDLTDACSEVQRIVTLFIDEDIARKFDNRVADILYRVEGD